MQSYWMQVSDGVTRLECRDTPMPEPGRGQLLVRMRAAGLNRGEFIIGQGQHGAVADAWKAIGGEGAGEVVRVGPEVTTFRPGDRVMGRCAGAFAEHALIDLGEAMAIPAALSWEEAAALPLTFLVTFDMLVLQGRLRAGEWLLINGVSSGVGVASLQLGKVLGAKVIGTSGSAAKLRRLEALHARRLTLFGVSNKQRSKAQKAAAVPRFVAEVLPHVAAGSIKPQIDQVVDFAALPTAKARMEAGEHVGKIVLRIAH